MSLELEPSVFVHERALCETDSIGPRTRVWAFAHLMPGAVIGADCNICDHVFVETGAVIGDRVIVKNNALIWARVTVADEVFVGPNVVFTNDRAPRVAFPTPADEWLATTVGRGATIGANATIVCGVSLGEQCFVGAGSVIVDDVPAYALMVGNPGRRIAWVCACSERLREDLRCACGRCYRLVNERSGLVAVEAVESR